MNITDLNNRMIFLLTNNRKEDESYLNTVKMLLEEYQTCLKKFDYDKYGIGNSMEIISEINDICQIVISCIENYNKAEIIDAITKIKNAINSYSMKLNSLTIDSKGDYKNWYRIRPQEDLVKLYKANEMFHIPFEMRYKIKNQRYSINGYPCLYLGRSVWGCWEEMHEIDFRFACVSRFEVQKELKLLNLCLPKKDKDMADPNEISCLLRTWPMIISCSIKVNKPNEPFKPEYIIPQLLMLAIKQCEEFIGCAYTSTQRNDYFDWDDDLLCNIAIPVKEVRDNGLCPILCNYFKVTDSGKEEYFRLKGEDKKGAKYEKSNGIIISFPLEKNGYKGSPFCFVEEKLKNKEAINLLSY